MESKLKIYPSGFFGSSVNPQTLPLDLISKAKQLFNNALITKVSPYTASLDVIELWSTVVNDDAEYRTFEFKENILKYALTAFGTDRLMDWINAQLESPEWSIHHSKWIDETIMFVYGGVRREFSHNNWITLLTAGNNTTTDRVISPILKAYLFNRSLLENKSNSSIKQFILSWVRQPGGIDDLIASLNVLYGKR
jgi:hypothetical protein